jgi:A/G-specific adenine glycosylase
MRDERKPKTPESYLIPDPSSLIPSSIERRLIRQALLRWFERSRRELPWRRDRDPYRIWVSETMLQQTQVAAVIPYFERFIESFPDIASLAHADEQDVLRLWEGLGYYRRARDLHQAARRLAAEHGGRLPDDPDVLRTLPGIGRYTMGAILSQAFDRRLPILEANSQRVLSRLIALQDDPRRGAGRATLWAVAASILPTQRVGEFNQALMELGALVCTSQTPACSECPLAKVCVARKQNLQVAIPLRPTQPATVDVHEVAVVIRRGQRVLLAQRPEHGRWAGLWEFPHDSLQEGELHEQAADRVIRELTGLQAAVGTELTTVRHGVTHQRITLVCFEARYEDGRSRSSFYRQSRWTFPAELSRYPLSSPQRRLAKSLLPPARQQRMF